MNDVLLIKKLNMRRFNKNDVIPVTFNLGVIDDKAVCMEIFEELREKGLCESDRVAIKNDSLTIEVKPDNISEVIKELLTCGMTVYGAYILYDNYLGAKNCQ